VCYFHLVFSVPHTLVPLIWHNQKILFALLFEASAATQRANEEEHCSAWLMQCREQRARAVHVASRRISSIDQIPRPLI
jgi:hypothetical protein